MKEAGSIDHEKVCSTLFHLDTMTIIGRFGLNSTGKQIRQSTFIVTVAKGTERNCLAQGNKNRRAHILIKKSIQKGCLMVIDLAVLK